MDKKRESIYRLITDKSMTYAQKKHFLALETENILPYPDISAEAKTYFERGIIDDLYEGHAPYRPRYLLPDYEKFFLNGSEFLELKPPQTLFQAIQSLNILYSYVPSVTGYPVYLGNVDTLLEPFVLQVSESTAYEMIKWYLIAVDRMCPDAFAHLNIGPKDTKTGRLLLKADLELKQAVPNISLKYDPKVTSRELALLAVESALTTSKPHFHNHQMITSDLEKYGVVSCYNNLRIGGGSHTLIRINLRKLIAENEVDLEKMLAKVIPLAARLAVEVANARTKFLVEEVQFFKHSFLVRESLVSLDKFTSMIGVFGLAEAVNLMMARAGLNGQYGSCTQANELGYSLIKQLKQELLTQPALYCQGTEGRVAYHSQSGISEDVAETAGTRIPIGQEPELFKHIRAVAPMHKYFNSGVSDIFIFEPTAKDNKEGVLDIIKGAMEAGIRTFTINNSCSELVRITGYLVRQSDVEKFKQREVIRNNSTGLGAEAIANQRLLERRVYRNNFSEESGIK